MQRTSARPTLLTHLSRLPYLAALLFAAAATGCGKLPHEPPETTFSGPTMGTRYTVKLSGLPIGLKEDELKAAIEEQLETINNQMSTYRPDSELSRFNRQLGTDWFEVSPATLHVVATSIAISELSGGAFDATVAPLVELWNFGYTKGADRIPSAAEISEARIGVGYRKIQTRQQPPALRKQDARVSIDLSAIAKGFAVDRIAEYLDQEAVAGFMVEIGGEVRTKGIKGDGTTWIIGIVSPEQTTRGVHKAVELADLSMATSGDYLNYYERDGKRYSHTINPVTGRPVEHKLASVSVVCPECMRADAWATALMVLGPQEGYNLAAERDLAVLLIVRAEGRFVEKSTPAFDLLVTTTRGNK
jgi:thiamine biosynthesis lipoprotein